MILKTQYGQWPVKTKWGQYNNGRTSLELIHEEDGDPVMIATVNLPDADVAQDEVVIKNYSENEGVLDFLIEQGIVHEPNRYLQTGFVIVPVCKLVHPLQQAW